MKGFSLTGLLNHLRPVPPPETQPDTHHVTVKTTYRDSRAECACGWWSGNVRAQSTAVRAGLDHLGHRADETPIVIQRPDFP